MKPFKFSRIDSLQGVTELTDVERTRYIAGGTNLVDLMKHQIEQPQQVVDVTPVDGLRNIVQEGDVLSVGALVNNTQLACFAAAHSEYKVLADAILSGANVQIRNRATTAGNLLQRTRCYYFYETSTACNKRMPGSGCAAREGYNRIHAILGTSPSCIASHPSDMAVAMVALNAQVHTLNPNGQQRQIALTDLYTLPGETPHTETLLDAGELITQIKLMGVAKGTHLYRKVRDRQSFAFALVSVACVMTLENRKIKAIRLAYGGVGTVPWRGKLAEQILIGQAPEEALFKRAADAELQAAIGYGFNDFKIPLFRQTFIEVLHQVAESERARIEGDGDVR